MKYLLLLFSFTSAFAVCDLCVKVEKEITAWQKAETAALRERASRETHFLFERLALAIHGGDKNLVGPTVKLFGAMYSRDYDPFHQELEHFETDLKNPKFEAAFLAEAAKLPSEQKEKLLAALEARKNYPEKDDAPEDH